MYNCVINQIIKTPGQGGNSDGPVELEKLPEIGDSFTLADGVVGKVTEIETEDLEHFDDIPHVDAIITVEIS
ncbi:hypothetical protein ERX37_08100 [Macrococcus hajekii]|uniref:Uncharacterized protein n=1 Tax=Macrococcus hajekii TaxID=198482 RepID=A0A4R6BII5_9STAP|nr:hypothetical protein [Macrococcus hajekii]TDM01453.1 hypothetical protein ERX37_08100 [Macrococcus hajekii]GGB00122.1 hypothetical protein GCM10007190_05190 [Macrococcus hajekii]